MHITSDTYNISSSYIVFIYSFPMRSLRQRYFTVKAFSTCTLSKTGGYLWQEKKCCSTESVHQQHQDINKLWHLCHMGSCGADPQPEDQWFNSFLLQSTGRRGLGQDTDASSLYECVYVKQCKALRVVLETRKALSPFNIYNKQELKKWSHKCVSFFRYPLQAWVVEIWTKDKCLTWANKDTEAGHWFVFTHKPTGCDAQHERRMLNLWVSSAVSLEGDEQAMVVKGTVTRVTAWEQLVVRTVEWDTCTGPAGPRIFSWSTVNINMKS